MPGQPEDTARHSLESIAPCASILRRVLLFTEMAVRLRGVPKGSRGKPRAAFEGARTNNKATRTLWRVALPSTTAMPFAVFQKTLGKTDQGSPIKSKSVNNRRHQLSTVNDTCAADLRGWTRIRKLLSFRIRVHPRKSAAQDVFISDSLDQRYAEESARRFRLDPWNDMASRRRPRRCRRCRDAPTKFRLQTLLETLQP